MASTQVLKLALFLVLRAWYALTCWIGAWCVRRRLMWLCRIQCRLMLLRPSVRGLYALGWRPRPPGGMGAGAPHKDQMTNRSV